MNEATLNDFLIKGRKASDEQRAKGNSAMALAILQVTSLIALRQLPESHKVICRSCSRQLHNGKEIEFYKHVGMCYSCDSASVDSSEQYEQDIQN